MTFLTKYDKVLDITDAISYIIIIKETTTRTKEFKMGTQTVKTKFANGMFVTSNANEPSLLVNGIITKVDNEAETVELVQQYVHDVHFDDIKGNIAVGSFVEILGEFRDGHACVGMVVDVDCENEYADIAVQEKHTFPVETISLTF